MSLSSGAFGRLSRLPVVVTPILGRERETAQIVSLMRDAACRLVTLTGPGGVGKSRLAIHVAGEMFDEDGIEVVFVPLAAVRDPANVLPTIAQEVGLIGDAGANLEDRLAEHLSGVRMLLVLDNLEQVLAAAPAVGSLLGQCPDLTILATSQAPLGIAGEQLFPLSPLATPSANAASTEDILHADAVALFLQRARAVNPMLEIDSRNAETIAEICRRLDGLPLAIELAAARTNILSPAALLARLSNRLQVLGGERSDVPQRLRTMRHAIAWSYDLLAPDEQAVFRQLSVFAGGFSLEAVEAIVGPRERSAYDILGALVDHSLVQARTDAHGEARFLMLETLRDFGIEQLVAKGEDDAARLAHAHHITALAESADPHLTGREQGMWVQRLGAEVENLRAAMTWALDHGHEALVLRTCGAIWRFFSMWGLNTEGRAWLDAALQSRGPEVAPYRVKALIATGNLAEDHRDLDASLAAFEQARHLGAAMGQRIEEQQALIGIGTVAHDRGDYATATAAHEEALAIARQIGYQRGIAVSAANLASVSYYQGDLAAAMRYWHESQGILRELGDELAESISACNLGAVALELERFDEAESYLQRAYDLQRKLNSLRDIPYTLINMGDVASELGDYTLAHDAFAEAIMIFREAGETATVGVVMTNIAALYLRQGQVREAAAALLEAIEGDAARADPSVLPEIAFTCAALCIAQGNHGPAATLLGAVRRLREDAGVDLTPRQATRERRLLDQVREALGDDAQAHQDAGRNLDAASLQRRATILAREVRGPQHADPVNLPDPAAEADGPTDVRLTQRELEILQLLAAGKSTKEIASDLFVSPRTIATHITNILNKLDVTSRTAAVAWAMRMGLV